MALLHYLWSRTAASNSTADSNVNWAEGQAPSSVNDSARAMMASLAGYRDDIAGAIVTTGTSGAYSISSYQVFDSLAHMNGQVVAFTPHATNTADATLNVDGLGAKPIRATPGVAIQSGVLIQSTPYTALYNSSDAVWYLHNFYGASPYLIPIAGGMDYWASTAPNSSFAFPKGQAISRTTYATLFALISTTYGVGDGTTTFNLPDKRGRSSAMLEDSATRLTSTYFGGTSTNLGATGGTESMTVVTANLPPYTPAGTLSSIASTISTVHLGGTSDNFGSIAGSGAFSNFTRGTISSTGTFTGTAQGGASTPTANVQPTIICNYIMRII